MMVSEDRIALTLSLPRDVWERLRDEAATEDRPLTRHIVRILRARQLAGGFFKYTDSDGVVRTVPYWT